MVSTPTTQESYKLALLLPLSYFFFFFFCSKEAYVWYYTKTGDQGTELFLKRLALLGMEWSRGRAQGKMCLPSLRVEKTSCLDILELGFLDSKALRKESGD